MAILFSKEFMSALLDELNNTQSEINVISAFCKESVIEFINSHLNQNVKKKNLMVRYRLEDLLKGVTDFSIYKFCKEHNWNLYVDFDLHAKTYIFDRKRCIIGSANATNKGIGNSNSPNAEISCICELSDIDLQKIDLLFRNSFLMDDATYNKMSEELNGIETTKAKSIQWSKEIQNMLLKDIKVLFSNDFPDSLFDQKHADFLEIDDNIGIDQLKIEFKKSKVYRWLYNELLLKPNKEIYFGELSAILHSKLVEDPKPYRKDIKILLSNLISWITALDGETILADRPNYSQRLRLK